MNDVIVGEPARALIGLLVLVAVSLVVYAAVALPRRTGITSALEPYSIEPLQPPADAPQATVVDRAVIRRGADVTARLFRLSDLLPAIEALLEQAAWSVRAPEALFLYVVAFAVLTVAGTALAGTGGGILAAVLAGLAPIVVLRLAISRRRQSFESQLPDALQMLASSLASGRSFLQALQGLAEETAEPMASELSRALAEARLGRPVEDALAEMATRMASEDARFVASAVRIQRQIGGNLADLLGIVAQTMVERDRIRGEVRALTAEGRISAVVLAILPIGLGIVMYAVDREYVSVLFHDPIGRAMVAVAAGLAVGGFLWMRKTMEVDL